MNCHKVQSLVSAYVDGELGGHEMLAIRQHLAECEECAAEYESLLSLKRMFGRLQPKHPRIDLATRICNELDRLYQPTHERWLGFLRKYIHPFPARIRFAAAGLAILAALLMMRISAPMSPYTSSPEYTFSAQAMADSHIGETAIPVSTSAIGRRALSIHAAEGDPLSGVLATSPSGVYRVSVVNFSY